MRISLFRTNIKYVRTKIAIIAWRENKEDNQIKKEQAQALLLRAQEKEETQFKIWRLRENMKYIVKIQGKQF